MIRQLWLNIIHIGIDINTSETEKRRILVMNICVLFVSVFGLLFCIYGFWVNVLTIFSSLSVLLFGVVSFILTYKKMMRASKFLLILVGIIISTTISLLFGERDGAEHGHFVVVVLILVLFNNKKYIIFLSFLAFCGLMIAKWSFFYPPIIKNVENIENQFLASVGAIFIAHFIALFTFKLEHYRTEKVAKDTYEEMKSLSEEVNTQNEELRQQQEELVAQRDYLTKQALILEEQTQELLHGQKEMELANKEVQIILNKVQQQKKEVEEHTYDITQSITYAKKIQNAILPQLEDIKKAFKENFLFSKAKDIVSGDFCWFNSKMQDNTIAVVADCTGHGVPGAILSMLGINLLNQIAAEHKIYDPASILNELDKLIRRQLRQDVYDIGEIQDGMEMALCSVDKTHKMLYYATARRTIYLLRNKQIIVLKGNKEPIGGSLFQKKNFQTFEIPLQDNDLIYMFSDGFSDQFNNRNDEKYSIGRLKDLLIRLQSTKLDYQKEIISTAFDEWKGYTAQTDDVLILGFKPLS